MTNCALMLIAKDLMRPSFGTSPHHRAVTFAAHAVVGALFASPLGLFNMTIWSYFVFSLIVGVLYWKLKEMMDLKNGGALWDSVEDTIGVMIGGFYGFFWWPVLVLAATAIVYGRGLRLQYDDV